MCCILQVKVEINSIHSESPKNHLNFDKSVSNSQNTGLHHSKCHSFSRPEECELSFLPLQIPQEDTDEKDR